MSDTELRRRRAQTKSAADMVSSESLPTGYSHRAGVWTDAEDELLYSWQQRIGNKWSEVARHIPGKTGQQCAQRWRHKVNPDIKRDKWSKEEDTLLVQLVHQYGNHWAQIARNVPGRTDQQCMGRWKRHLDPNIKRANWSLNEDIVLCALYFRYHTQWSAIARGLDGRTPQQCRTRWQNLSQSHFVKTYHAEINKVDIEAVERAQMAINAQRESITGLPTATTRARMLAKKRRASGGKKYTARSGEGPGDHREPGHVSSEAAETLMNVVQNPHEYLGSLNTLQYPPNMSPPQRYPAFLPHFPQVSEVGEAPRVKRRRGRPSKADLKAQEAMGGVNLGVIRATVQHTPSVLLHAAGSLGGAGAYDLHAGRNDWGQFIQPETGSAGRAPRSGGRERRPGFDGTVRQLAMIDQMWRQENGFGLHPSNGAVPYVGDSRPYDNKKHLTDVQTSENRKLAPQDAVVDDMMLPIGRLHQNLTPLKPSSDPRGVSISVGGTGSAGGSGGKDDSVDHQGHALKLDISDRYGGTEDKDTSAFLGLEYLSDEKVPGSKTPLSALKHAPKAAISPMLADLLSSPLINRDQLRGMHGLLVSPPGSIKRGSNPIATPESNRNVSDVVRCLDLSEAVTSSIGGISGSRLPGPSSDPGAYPNPANEMNGFQAFNTDSTPVHIGTRPPLVLDSAGRTSAGSVLMKNALAGDLGQTHYPFYDNMGLNRQQFVHMPVSNDTEKFVPGSAGAGVGEVASQGAAAPTAVPTANFHRFMGNDKGVNKRRLSIDNVRMSLHALLDKA